jgi:D-alanyl-D-alanine carboxypeptidase
MWGNQLFGGLVLGMASLVLGIGQAEAAVSVAVQQKAALNQFADQHMQQKNHPFTALSLLAQCKLAKPQIVMRGYAGKAERYRVERTSLFPIASITKSFISVVVLQLLREQKISLEQPIGSFFPEYTKWSKVTIRQLLNMTSGIPGNGTSSHKDILSGFSKKQLHGYILPRRLVDLAYQRAMLFKPGQQYNYSNTNYVLLGMLIGKLTDQDPVAVIAQRIFTPLQLKHTYFVKNNLSSLPGVQRDQIIQGYDYYPPGGHPAYSFLHYGENTTAIALSSTSYDGAIVSTTLDINRFIHALYTPNRLLNAKQIDQLTRLISVANGQWYQPKKQPQQMGYGLGILGQYDKASAQMWYFYQGQLPGYQFIYVFSPQSQQALVVAFNSSSRVFNKRNVLQLFARLNQHCQP